jgi:protoheme IX farnesyltransferase
MKSVITNYVNLTKPTIVLLFTLTGLTSMVIEGSLLHSPTKFLVILFCIAITAGSANSLNMYFDRDIDELMKRTKRKRPLPLKTITPLQALWFGLILGVIATTTLYFVANLLTAALGLATILFYVVIYTLILKRRTPYNIVIGGAAGATAPLMGWAAGTGHLSFLSWVLFGIIFMWTPPHFWALALVVKDEYKEAGVPMLPVVAGDKRTRFEILVYSLIMIPMTFTPVLLRAGGTTYLIASLFLGVLFMRQVVRLMMFKTDKSAYAVFGYSIVYLLALFIFLIIGSVAHSPLHIA